MINSLKIGETITTTLLSDNNLKTLIGNRFYPLVAPEGTKFPFIIYKRDSLTSNSCKDGYYEDVVSFTITIVSTKYSESVDIAQKVRKLIETQRITTEELEMNDTYINGASEEYVEESYVQTLNFITKTN